MGVWEASPACLACYRGIHDELMAKHRAEIGLASAPTLCWMSLTTEKLTITAKDPRCRDGILRKMLDEIWSADGGGSPLDDQELGFSSLAVMFAKDEVDAEVMEKFKRGGLKLCYFKEGL